MLLVNGMFNALPLQTIAVAALVITGSGFTVTVMQLPVAVQITPFKIELTTRR